MVPAHSTEKNHPPEVRKFKRSHARGDEEQEITNKRREWTTRECTNHRVIRRSRRVGWKESDPTTVHYPYRTQKRE
jgi:hypothetical protein